MDDLTAINDKNVAFYWSGIPIYRSGEENGFEVLATSGGSIQEIRTRFQGTITQLFLNTVLLAVFTRNTFWALVLVKKAPRNLSCWCCLIQAGAGCFFSAIAVTFSMPSPVSCRAIAWLHIALICVSNVCVSAVLLHKAWLVHKQDNRLIYFSVLLLIPQPACIYVVWALSPTLILEHAGCVFIYPHYYPWLKLGVEMPINIFLSGAFLIVIVRQYRAVGSVVWARLSKEGFIYMFGVIFSNFFCALVAALKIFGDFSDIFFIGDCKS
ncbi:hypothetical protein BDF19DRAFT_16043 [Syncephalis fuscata]|nr:hypothetical protein BDF19DRAFT_16043 [Syncephalis fuscata]